MTEGPRVQRSVWFAWALGPGACGVLAVLSWHSPDYWLGPTPNGCCGMLPILGVTHLIALHRTVVVLASADGPRLLGRMLIAYFVLVGAFVADSAVAGMLPDSMRGGPAGSLCKWTAALCVYSVVALIPAMPLTALLRTWVQRRRRREDPRSTG